ncbi:MAG: ATP-dependent RecD-like DNA helicase, partial [Candidatus Lambdaproteobacteria bacterium]|nr:ATP-dependent RecD-like DNA helicase [Candidatus Lambdaproteobacteria bacterium]
MNDQTLLGTLDHITFQNPESHFLVGRLLAEERPEPVTIKGRLYNVHEGQTLKVWGRWEEHREYGLQFVVDAFMEMLPSSLAGMERYLASG